MPVGRDRPCRARAARGPSRESTPAPREIVARSSRLADEAVRRAGSTSAISRQPRDALDALRLAAELFVERDARELLRLLLERRLRSCSQKKRASESRAAITRSLPATISLPPSLASMLETRMKRLVRAPPDLPSSRARVAPLAPQDEGSEWRLPRSDRLVRHAPQAPSPCRRRRRSLAGSALLPQHKAFLVLPDGQPNHLRRDRRETPRRTFPSARPAIRPAPPPPPAAPRPRPPPAPARRRGSSPPSR